MQLRSIISRIAVAFAAIGACLAVAASASAGMHLNEITLGGGGGGALSPPPVYVPKLECHGTTVKQADGSWRYVKVCQP